MLGEPHLCVAHSLLEVLGLEQKYHGNGLGWAPGLKVSFSLEMFKVQVSRVHLDPAVGLDRGLASCLLAWDCIAAQLNIAREA